MLAALARLVDQSFVRRGPPGRFEIHELMRQYGAAKLLERPEEEQAARDHHASYYLSFLIRKEWSLRGSGQRRVIETVARDIENVRAAWNWAVGQYRLGEYDRTEAISREGLYLAEELDSPIYKVPYLCCLGSAARGRGHYDQSHRFLSEALQVAYDGRLWPPLMMILYELARLYVAETDGDEDGKSGGGAATALELLTVVIEHPATWQGVRDRAARLHAELEAALPPTIVTRAKDQGKGKTLDAVVDQLSGLTVDSG